MTNDYKKFKGIYGGEPSIVTGLVFVLCVSASYFVLHIIDSNTKLLENLRNAFGIAGWLILGLWVILTAVFMGLSYTLFLSSYETERRRKLIACPKCQHETKIVKDDLFSENIIEERKKDSNNKLKIEHYRVGTRLVTIACESCDYTKGYELKFKEKA